MIIGPDLVWRKDGWVAVRGANKDPDFRNLTKVSERQFERLVRNVYKVLLTRGMIGTVIYSTRPRDPGDASSLGGNRCDASSRDLVHIAKPLWTHCRQGWGHE